MGRRPRPTPRRLASRSSLPTPPDRSRTRTTRPRTTESPVSTEVVYPSLRCRSPAENLRLFKGTEAEPRLRPASLGDYFSRVCHIVPRTGGNSSVCPARNPGIVFGTPNFSNSSRPAAAEPTPRSLGATGFLSPAPLDCEATPVRQSGVPVFIRTHAKRLLSLRDSTRSGRAAKDPEGLRRQHHGRPWSRWPGPWASSSKPTMTPWPRPRTRAWSSRPICSRRWAWTSPCSASRPPRWWSRGRAVHADDGGGEGLTAATKAVDFEEMVLVGANRQCIV